MHTVCTQPASPRPPRHTHTQPENQSPGTDSILNGNLLCIKCVDDANAFVPLAPTHPSLHLPPSPPDSLPDLTHLLQRRVFKGLHHVLPSRVCVCAYVCVCMCVCCVCVCECVCVCVLFARASACVASGSARTNVGRLLAQEYPSAQHKRTHEAAWRGVCLSFSRLSLCFSPTQHKRSHEATCMWSSSAACSATTSLATRDGCQGGMGQEEGWQRDCAINGDAAEVVCVRGTITRQYHIRI